jgi:hypothetical protein
VPPLIHPFRQSAVAHSVILWAILSLARTVAAQTSQSPPNDQTGVAAYQSFGGQRENISLATGNLNLQIPLLTIPGRNGHDMTIALEYDSTIWQLTSTYDCLN